MPFDPTVAPKYNPDDIKDDVPESGLGLFLMQQFMDEVAFQNLGREGKELHLIKYLHQERIGQAYSETAGSDEKPETKSPIPPKSIPFTVRKAKLSDAIEDYKRCLRSLPLLLYSRAYLLSWSFQGVNWKRQHFLGQRHSSVLYYYTMPVISSLSLKRYKGNIYPPPHHREMIEKIYANLNKNPKLVDADNITAALIESPAKIDVRCKSDDRHAVIEVKSYGADIMRQIGLTVKKLCLNKIEVIYLYLNLKNPLTASLTKDFETMAFFFLRDYARAGQWR